MSAAAVFCGSFLLFMIQPLLGRTLLPVFGGSAGVWCVCLAAYQLLLLAGYAYAHGVAKWPLRRQRSVHVALLLVAVVWSALTATWGLRVRSAFGASSVPALEVLLCVLAFVGLPYVLLAAGSTLVQSWQAGTQGETGRRDVYRLYAVSNLGSLLGLLTYPFALEPFVALKAQWVGFAAGLAAYVALLAMWRPSAGSAREVAPLCPSEVEPVVAPRAKSSVCLWCLLPGVSAFLLNAVLAHLFTDVTPMPLVWVVMLAVFLLSYAVGFSPAGEARRGLWCGLAAAALAGSAWASGLWGTGSFIPNAVAAVALVFFAGVVLHGWLYAERPEHARLTRFYLCIAAGGAGGGLLASLIAPLVFSRVLEYPLILFVCAVLTAWRSPKPGIFTNSAARARLFAVGCGIAWLVLSWVTARHSTAQTIFRSRNFYGCLRVSRTYEAFGREGVFPVHYLWCGQTTHGLEVLGPQYKGRGTSYYGLTGGGIAFNAFPRYREGQRVKVGVVGLGAGCLARYGRSGDLFRFYEINPQVVRVATDRRLFTFLPDAPMPIDLVLGDARRMLEKEREAGDPRYDVLVIDAYSGDAVPYHLATREAFKLYLDRLEEDGVLAVHVSNWHIDLLPLCKAVASELGVCAYGVVGGAEDSLTTGAIWVFMTRRPMAYRYPRKELAREVVWGDVRDISVPTDEKGSLIPLLRF